MRVSYTHNTAVFERKTLESSPKAQELRETERVLGKGTEMVVAKVVAARGGRRSHIKAECVPISQSPSIEEGNHMT